MRHVARVLVQQRHGGYELPNETDGRIDIEQQAALVRDPQDVGETRAFDMVRYDGQSGGVRMRAVDAAHPGIVAMAEIGETSDPLP